MNWKSISVIICFGLKVTHYFLDELNLLLIVKYVVLIAIYANILHYGSTTKKIDYVELITEMLRKT